LYDFSDRVSIGYTAQSSYWYGKVHSQGPGK
jgi:hypothetical protein